MTSTNLGILLSIVNLAVNALLTVALFYVASKARRIETLEAQLRETAHEMVQQRFAALSAECRIRCAGWEVAMGDIRERLARGDGDFESLGEAGHRLELKVTERIAELKDFVRANCASKGDVDAVREKVAELSGRFAEVEKGMTLADERVKG